MTYFQKIEKLLKILPDGVMRRGLLMGVAAATEHASIIRNIPFDTLIDVGANKGQFSLIVRAYKPQSRIIAFEPIPRCAAVAKHLFARDTRFSLHVLAAGKENKSMPINISARVDSSSLLGITSVQTTSFMGTQSVGCEEVEVCRIDDVLARDGEITGSVLVKIDVQGYELIALEGMQETLKRVDYVYVELSFLEFYENQPLAAEVVSWLSERGFKLSSVNNISLVGDDMPGQADFLFRRVV